MFRSKTGAVLLFISFVLLMTGCSASKLRSMSHTGPTIDSPLSPREIAPPINCDLSAHQIFADQCVKKCRNNQSRNTQGVCIDLPVEQMCNSATHEIWNTQCLVKCTTNQLRNAQGQCENKPPVCDLSANDFVGGQCLRKCLSNQIRNQSTLMCEAASCTNGTANFPACNDYAVAAIHCSLYSQGTLPVDFGGTITATITCSNLPANAVVRMMGTKNGSNDSGQVISITNLIPFVDTRTNDASEKAGTYTQKIVVQNTSNQAVLFTSNEISYEFLLPAPKAAVKCKFRMMEQRSGIVFGSTVTEQIYCSNLNERTEVRLIGTKNGIQDVDKVIAVTNPATNPYSIENYGEYYFRESRQHDDAEKVGVYTRKIVVKDIISQNVLFISEERKYELLPDLGCVVTVTETAPGYVVEKADCKYIPPGAIVSLWWPDADGSYRRYAITLPYSVHRTHNEFERMAGASIRYYYYRDIEVTNESRTLLYAANHFDIYILK